MSSSKAVLALTASLIAGTLSVEARQIVQHSTMGSGHQIRADLVKEMPADVIATNDGEGSCGKGTCGGGDGDGDKTEKKTPQPTESEDEDEECPGGVCPADHASSDDDVPDKKWY